MRVDFTRFVSLVRAFKLQSIETVKEAKERLLLRASGLTSPQSSQLWRGEDDLECEQGEQSSFPWSRPVLRPIALPEDPVLQEEPYSPILQAQTISLHSPRSNRSAPSHLLFRCLLSLPYLIKIHILSSHHQLSLSASIAILKNVSNKVFRTQCEQVVGPKSVPNEGQRQFYF